MNVLMLIDAYYPIEAGAEVFARYLAEHLVKRKHRVDVLTRRMNQVSEREDVNGVNVFRTVPTSHVFRKLCKEYFFLKNAINLNKQNNYDIIHLHLASPRALTGLLLKRILQKPVVLSVQGGDLFDYGLSTKLGFKPLLKYALKQFNSVHAVSSVYGSLLKHWGVKDVVVIPNCVDLDAFCPNTKEKREGIITVSRLIKKNGIHHLILALSVLKSEGEIVNLTIIGTGPWEKKLRRMVKQHHLEKQVEFLGYIPNNQLKIYLSSSLLFVRPSLWEGFGVSFIEAMASGTCVIGSKTGGITDIISNKKNGFLVEVGDIQGLAKTLHKALTDVQLRQRLVKEGYATVEKQFSCKNVLPKVEKWYEEVIHEARHR